jgi:valyl-tRNA synthetase
MTIGPDTTKPHGAASAVVKGGTVWVPLEGIIDVDVERERLRRENERLENLVSGAERKLGNADFVSRAKPEIVERERDKLASLKDELGRVVTALADLT